MKQETIDLNIGKLKEWAKSVNIEIINIQTIGCNLKEEVRIIFTCIYNVGSFKYFHIKLLFDVFNITGRFTFYEDNYTDYTFKNFVNKYTEDVIKKIITNVIQYHNNATGIVYIDYLTDEQVAEYNMDPIVHDNQLLYLRWHRHIKV